MPDVARVMCDVLALHLEIDPRRLRPEARLLEDLRVDSLTAIELAMVLEDEFDISLPEEVVAHVCTYGDMLEVVTERVEATSTRGE